jgi:transcriptional regulator with XRE-family HTH domain
MTISQKLEEVTKFMRKSSISRAVGLTPGGFTNILTGVSIPGSDTLLKIARVLNLDPGWLIDDSRSLPAVYVSPREIGSPIRADTSNLSSKEKERLAEIDAAAAKEPRRVVELLK